MGVCDDLISRQAVIDAMEQAYKIELVELQKCESIDCERRDNAET